MLISIKFIFSLPKITGHNGFDSIAYQKLVKGGKSGIQKRDLGTGVWWWKLHHPDVIKKCVDVCALMKNILKKTKLQSTNSKDWRESCNMYRWLSPIYEPCSLLWSWRWWGTQNMRLSPIYCANVEKNAASWYSVCHMCPPQYNNLSRCHPPTLGTLMHTNVVHAEYGVMGLECYGATY